MGMILPIVTFLPLVGALLCMALPREEEQLHRSVGFGTALVTFLVSLLMLSGLEPAKMNHVVDWAWVESLGIRFNLGIDGISVVRFGSADVVRHPIVGRIVEHVALPDGRYHLLLRGEARAKLDELDASYDEHAAILEDEDSAEEAVAAAETAIEAIERECQEIRARPPVIAPELKAEAGMVLVLSRDGT